MSRQADATSLLFIALSSLLFACSSGGYVGESIDAGAAVDATDAAVEADAAASPPDMAKPERLVVPRYRSGSTALAQPVFFDRELSVRCQPQPTISGLRCLPLAQCDVFTDKNCATPAMYVRSCEKPTYCIWEVQQPECRTSEYKVAAVLQVTQTEYFVRNDTGCVPKPIATGYALHVAAAELSPTTFASVVEEL